VLARKENQVIGHAGAVADSVAERIARSTLEKRGETYAREVRRLLDAGLELMRTSKPRVADIVAAAGLSNEAFYRHFSSKDALVEAIIQDGAERLRSYLDHQMAKEPTPEGKLRRWVEGVLDQAADPEIAATTLAVLGNGVGVASGQSAMREVLGSLLREPLVELGSADPDLDAGMTSSAVVGTLSAWLETGRRPSTEDVEQAVAFCLRAVSPRG
jgi:AcrR family transcriptional regulator